MINKPIESIYEKVPAVICTAGSYIAAINNAALRDVKGFSRGEVLYDSMRPEDILKFEADLLSGENGMSQVFELCGFYGFRRGVALFRRLLGKSFAVVFLFKDPTEAEDESFIEHLSCYDLLGDRSFFNEFIRISFHVDLGGFSDENRLMDMYDICRTGVIEMARRRDIYSFDISFCENNNEKSNMGYFSDVPMRSFLQVLFLAALIAGEITVERRVEVRLCKYGDDVEIRLTTDHGRVNIPVNTLDELALCVPSASSYVNTCEYVASRVGCSTFVLFSQEQKKLSMVFSFGKSEFEDVDFKCPMKNEMILKNCAMVLDRVHKLMLSNAKEQSEN